MTVVIRASMSVKPLRHITGLCARQTPNLGLQNQRRTPHSREKPGSLFAKSADEGEIRQTRGHRPRLQQRERRDWLQGLSMTADYPRLVDIDHIQVEADQVVPVEYGEDGAKAEEGSERQFVVPVFTGEAHHNDSDHGSKDRSDKDSEERQRRADEGTDHGHHLDIAEPHSFYTPNPEIRLAHSPEQPSTDGGTDQTRYD